MAMSAGFSSGQRAWPNSQFMARVFVVALGGAIGSVARYLLSGLVQRITTPYFPTGTFAVNVIGWFRQTDRELRGDAIRFSPEVRLFLIVGLCGGFTTFSALGWETLELVGRDAVWHAAVNVFGQLIAGLAATLAGLALARSI